MAGKNVARSELVYPVAVIDTYPFVQNLVAGCYVSGESATWTDDFDF